MLRVVGGVAPALTAEAASRMRNVMGRAYPLRTKPVPHSPRLASPDDFHLTLGYVESRWGSPATKGVQYRTERLLSPPCDLPSDAATVVGAIAGLQRFNANSYPTMATERMGAWFVAVRFMATVL